MSKIRRNLIRRDAARPDFRRVHRFCRQLVRGDCARGDVVGENRRRSDLLRRDRASRNAVCGDAALGERTAVDGGLGELRRAVGGVDRVDDGLFAADDDEPLHGQRARGDPVRGQLDDFGVGDGCVGDLRRAHRSGLDERRGDRAQRNLSRADGRIGDVGVGDRGVGDFRAGHGEVGDFGGGDGSVVNLRRRDGEVGDPRLVHGQQRDLCPRDRGVLNVRGADRRLRNLRGGDGRVGDLGGGHGQIRDVRRGDGGFGNLGGRDACQRDLGRRNARVRDLRFRDARLLDARRRDGRFGNFRRGDARVRNLGARDLRVADVRGLNRRFRDERGGDRSRLDVSRLNGRHLNLQTAHGTGLQLPRTHRVDGQLAAGDDARGQLARGDGVSFQRVRNSAQRDGGVSARQAVVGVLRHAQRYADSQLFHQHAHRVSEKDVLQKTVLAVFLRVGAVDEIHLQRDRGQVAALVELRLGRAAHLLIALRLRLFPFALFDFLCAGDLQMHPLRRGIAIQIRTVHIPLGQIEPVAVRVLAGGEDARGHVRAVHIIGNAQQVFALPDLDVRVRADALYEIHVETVPRQLSRVFLRRAAFAQQRFYRIDVFPLDLLCRALQIRIERKPMLGQTRGGDTLHDGSPRLGGRGLQRLDHIVEQIVKNMPGIDRDLVQLRHDAIDAKRLIPQHLRLYNFAYRILRRAFRAHTGQILRRHISALPIRAGDLVPVGRSLFQHDDLRSLFVFSEDPILRSRPGAQPQRVAPGGHAIDHGAAGGLRLHLIDARRHGRRHGRAENAPLAEPLPFAEFVNIVHQRKLPFAVQRFGDSAAHGCERTEAVVRKIGAVGFVYANQARNLQFGCTSTFVTFPDQLMAFAPGLSTGNSPLMQPFMLVTSL